MLAAEARVVPAVASARLVGNGRSRSAFFSHGTCEPSYGQCYCVCKPRPRVDARGRTLGEFELRRRLPAQEGRAALPVPMRPRPTRT